MKVAGFTFVRNALRYEYPVVEAITSVLPLCDYFVVAVGNSDDDTHDLVRSIGSPKIHIIQTVWDDSLREGGRVLAQETDKAFGAVPAGYDWCFYIQGDECVHEAELPVIRS
ncbi:MAG: glycosyltransferase family 2 protein, partial [Bacteroidota bacterium]